ncbi:MAG: hypothetical protein JXA17_06735 [Dehalococcoidales bacterium]|nr:hypothetical protein [Dehalococcoidales bacterium]
METIKIAGKSFLRCQQKACAWNIGWLGGLDWTEEPGRGTRVCNLGAKAILEENIKPPDNCQQWKSVLELARAEFLL